MAYHLNIRVLWTGGAPLPGTAFLLAMLVELRVPENSHARTLELQSHGRTAVQLLLDLAADRQDDGNRHVDGPAWDGRGCSDVNQWTRENVITFALKMRKVVF